MGHVTFKGSLREFPSKLKFVKSQDMCLRFYSLQGLACLTFGSGKPCERKPLNQRECECNEFSL